MRGDFIVIVAGFKNGRPAFPSFRGRTEEEARAGMFASLSALGVRIARFDVERVVVTD